METKQIEWGPSIFIIGYHIALIIGLPFYFFYHSPSLGIYVISAVLLYLSGLSVTAGYHRLYAHKTYKTNKFIEVILLFFATMSTQGSAFRWAFDHRLHHAYVDTDKDPYTVKRGFWHAHIIWLFQKNKPIDPKVISDLYRNKLLQFQHKYYVPLMLLTNGLSFLFVGYFFQDFLGAFVLAWGVRLFLLHHFTWFINSLAHFWGSQSYSNEHTAVDNYIISLLTFGEGYHNYHHTFANDYRNGIKWYHFDPTKWIIWLLNKFKLSSDLKKISLLRIEQRKILESKKELKEKIKKHCFLHKKNLEDKIETITEDLSKKLSEFYQLINQYREFKKQKLSKVKRQIIRSNIKTLKKNLKNNKRDWKRFSKSIIRFDPPEIWSI